MVVVIAIILLLPKYIGSQVTTSVTNLATSIDKMAVYSAQVIEIDEGWFSSTAIIKVGINFDEISSGELESMPTGKAQFLVDFKATHGPVIISDGFAVALVKWQATYSGNELKPLMQWDHSQAFYQISGIQQLWNVSQFEDQIQPFTIDNEAQNIQADFAGYLGNGTFSSSHFDYSATVGKTTIENDENAALISGVELQMSIDGNYWEALEGKLFDTDMVVKIGQFQLNDLFSQLEVISLQSSNIEMMARVDEKNATAKIDQRVNVNSASFSGYQIQDLKLDFAINQLSLVFLEKYQKMANQLAGQDPIMMQQEMLKFAQDNLLELLTKDPEVDFKNLSAILPEGKFDINAKAQTVAITKLPENLQDPEFWLSHLMAEANLQSDKAVAEMFATNYMRSQLMVNPQTAEMTPEQISQIAAEQAPAMLDAMMEQGFIVEENGLYKSTVTLKDKQAVLNGKPIPLPF